MSVFKTIKQLLTGTCNPNMKGCKMYWEWNWPSVWPSDYGFHFIDLSCDLRHQGDHSPGFHFSFVLFNVKLLDFGYYNTYHEIDDEDEF